MLGLFPAQRRCNRRQWLSMTGLAGLSGWLWPRMAGAENQNQSGTGLESGTARNCINIFLCGGPSQPDLWDLKPAAPVGIRTVFDPIQTNVPGMEITERLPTLAQLADKFAIVRSLHHLPAARRSRCSLCAVPGGISLEAGDGEHQ